MCLAIPGQVQEIYVANGLRMGRLDFGGITKEVCLECLPDISAGDYAIVHVGFAIAKVDEQSARETLATFAELGVVLEEELASDTDLNPPDGCHEVS